MGKRARDEEAKEEVRCAVELVGGEWDQTTMHADDSPNSLTPFEKQMISLKKSLPKYVLLLVACGYRVRCFGRDSRVISRRTGIMCIPAKPFEYSSIPYIRVDVYIQRLVAMGYHVAFADQESAAVRAVEGKTNIFSRSISQLYSRGTLLPGEHVQTNGEMAAEAVSASIGVNIVSSASRNSVKDVDQEKELESSEGNGLGDVVGIASSTVDAFAYTLLFLEYHVHSESDSSLPTFLEVVLVNFVKQQQTTLRLEVESAQTGKIERHTLAAFEDLLQRSDIAELILLGPLRMTEPSAEHPTTRPCSTTPAASCECYHNLGDILRQHVPQALTSLLFQYLSLQWGPTVTGEEDGGTVSMSAGWKRADQRMVDAVSDHLRPYQLHDLYRQLLEEWKGDSLVLSSQSSPRLLATEGSLPASVRRLVDNVEKTEVEMKDVQMSENALQSSTMTVPGAALYALGVFSSSCFSLSSRIKGSGGIGQGNVNMTIPTSLFQLLNATMTATGSRLLREWIAAPLRDYECILARQQAVKFLARNEDGGVIRNLLREASGRGSGGGNIGVYSSGSMDMEAIVARLHAHRCPVRELIRFLRCLRNMGRMARQLEMVGANQLNEEPYPVVSSSYSHQEETIVENHLPLLLHHHLISTHPPVLEAWMSSHARGLLESGATTELELFSSGKLSWPSRMNVQPYMDKIAESERQLQEELSTIRSIVGMPTLEYRVIAGTPYVIDLPSSKADKTAMTNWMVISRTKTNVRYHTPAIVEASTALAAAHERIIGASREAWIAFQEELFQERSDVIKAIKTVVGTVGALDALHSLSLTARRQGYSAPRLIPTQCDRDNSPSSTPAAPIHNGSQKNSQCSSPFPLSRLPSNSGSEKSEENAPFIEIRQGRHPVVDELLHHQYVACDITFRKGDTILLTGPNMGGKSAFMRMVGIFVLMAQIGSFVPAESATLPIFDGLYCRMGASDNVLAGRSTFLTELEETSRILTASSLHHSFVLMDELGRGTSSYDGMAVASATLEYLVQKGATSIFVTHYTSLCEPYVTRPVGGAKCDGVAKLEEEHSPLSCASFSSTSSRVQCFFMSFSEESASPIHNSLPFKEDFPLTSSVGMVNRQKSTTEEERACKKASRILFTYRPCRGVTPSSFGIQVALMAGLPYSVTDEAEKQSKRVELLYQLTKDVTQISQFMLRKRNETVEKKK